VAVIDYIGNMNNEINQINEFQSTVDSKIDKINATLEVLKTVWQDDQSGPYIAKQTEDMNALKAANLNCKNQTAAYFEEIQRTLKIYGI